MPRKKIIHEPGRLPPIPMTDELRARFVELDREYRQDDNHQACELCGWGVGIGKVRVSSGRLYCVPCVWTLAEHGRPTSRDAWALLRLPNMRRYLTHSERASLHVRRDEAA